MLQSFNMRGFSLAEMVIAILILSVVSVVLVGVMPACIIGLHGAENRAAAAALGRQVLEETRSQGFSRIASQPRTEMLSNRQPYDVEVRVGPLGSLDPALAKQIEIVVTWHDRQGPMQHITRGSVFCN